MCFGTYDKDEGWTDLLGLVVDKKFRKRNIGAMLVRGFEKIVNNRDIETIDLYSNDKQMRFFKKLGHVQGGKYISFRKKL